MYILVELPVQDLQDLQPLRLAADGDNAGPETLTRPKADDNRSISRECDIQRDYSRDANRHVLRLAF